MATHPSELNGYRILEVLSVNPQGGRVAYLAEDRNGRRVVIKRFSFADFDASWSGFDDQRREIQVLRELDHPRIPAYVDWFTTDDGLCLVQEWLELAPLSVRTSYAAAEVKAIALSILDILIYLQERLPPVIHRDIKPANVLADDHGNAYLIDFGLARVGAGTASSIAVGTPGFMAPEQMLGRSLTPAADLFGLGATLIAMLTGTPAAELGELLDASMRFDLGRLPAGLNPAFVRWLEAMVAPELSDRFVDAHAARAALAGIEVRTRQRVDARPAAPSRPPVAPSLEPNNATLRSASLGILGVLGMLALVGFLAAGYWLVIAKDPPPEVAPLRVSEPVAAEPLEPEVAPPEPEPAPEPEPPSGIVCDEAMTVTQSPPSLTQGFAIQANSGCVLTLEGVTLVASVGIIVEEGARVVVVDSTIDATQLGLDVRGGELELTRSSVSAPTAAKLSGGGIVRLDAESTLTGETQHDEDGWIYGLDPEADAIRDRKLRLSRYMDSACWGVKSCYAGYQGRIEIEIRADIATDGTVGRVRFKGKRPPKAIAECVTEQLRSKPVADYAEEDGPGVRVCKVDAMMEGFMTSWGTSRAFELRG